MTVKKNKREVWSGSHLGIHFEINNWKTEPNSVEPFEKDNWTYYIYIALDKIPEQYKPDSFWLKGKKLGIGSHIGYDYYKHPVIGSIDFHCGITWYSKESGFDGASRVIKIGCDYQHYWDEGFHYNLTAVLGDVQKTIEDFRSHVPDYKYWCSGNGKLYDLKDGIIRNEEFYSEEYWGDKKWYIEEKKKQNQVLEPQ